MLFPIAPGAQPTDLFWPIGSVYVSVLNKNPADLMGFGVWQSLGAGRTLVGYDAADSDFNAAKKTGGAKTHTLTIAEMPSHNHVQSAAGQATGGLVGSTPDASTNNSVTSGYSTANTGGGGAHNNLQPFITVFFWERIA